jgi:maleylacetate reductase
VLWRPPPGPAAWAPAAAKDLPLAGTFDEAAMHTPVELAGKARRRAAELGADCCVAFGGGSTIGFAKAIALASGLPVIAVPTTYSGSEMTTIWGTSEGGRKQTGRDPRVAPKTVIYDPNVTLGLPAATSAVSGMNAIAHCVEALYAHDGNPVISLVAEEGIRALAAARAMAARPGVDSISTRFAPRRSTSAGSCASDPAPNTTRTGCPW